MEFQLGFQILKDDAVKVLHSIYQQIWKISSGHRTGKGQFSFQSRKRTMRIFHTIDLISHASRARLKILQTSLQQYVNRELSDVQAGFRKGIIEKRKELQKNIFFCFDCMDHNKLWKILKELGVPDHLLVFWETCVQVKKQQSELDMQQLTDSKLGKKDDKAVYHHPAYLTYTM